MFVKTNGVSSMAAKKLNLDPVILNRMRAATHPPGGHSNCIDLLSDEQLCMLYEIMDSRWRAGNNDIFAYATRVIREDWQVYENPERPTRRTLEQTIKKVFERVFGDIKALKRAKPSKKRLPDEVKALDAVRKQKDRLRAKYNPVLEQINFVDDISEKIEFWEGRAREAGLEKDFVAKLLAIKGKALRDAVEMFQSLGILDVKATQGLQALINIESLQVLQTIENRDSTSNLLGTLKARISEIAESTQAPSYEVIDVESELSHEIDTENESSITSPADRYRDTGPLTSGPDEMFSVSDSDTN